MLTAFCKTAVSSTLCAAGRQHLTGALSRRATLPKKISTSGKVGTVSFLHTESAPEHLVPWSLYIAERDKFQQESTQRLDKIQQEGAQRMYELGLLTAQNDQLLREVVYARAEIDVRGALEIIARIEEIKMPSKPNNIVECNRCLRGW